MDYVITFSDVMAGLMSIGLGVITFSQKSGLTRWKRKTTFCSPQLKNTTSTLNKKIERRQQRDSGEDPEE